MKKYNLNLLFLISLFISALLLNCEMSFSQVTQEWVKSYSSPQLNAQIAFDAVTDTIGNVYVTGSTSRGYSTVDMVTIKYNAAGVYVWGKTYNSTVTDYSNEAGRSIISYRNGTKTYLYSVGLNTSANYIIILKYNENGNQLWMKSFSYSAAGYINSTPKVMSDASGNCFVSGGTGEKSYLVKYDSSGTLVYNTIVPNPAGYIRSGAYDMAFDASGNIYMTGDCDSSSTVNYFTSKLNSAGVLQWSKIFRGLPNYQSRSREIAVGISGSVYVTGDYQGSTVDYLTIKYNPSTGDTIWTRKFNGTASGTDYGRLIALDAGENIYVSGITNYTSNGDMATVKYNSSGVQQWIKTYSGPGGYLDEPRDMAIDNSGNICIAGTSDFSLFGKTLAVKYNANGDSLWTRVYDIAVSDFEYPYAMTLDNSRNVIITGSSGYENQSEFGTIKYNSAGVLQWVRKFYGAQLINDMANGVVTDKYGNVYAAGRTRTNLGDNISVIKYNSAGVEKWVYNRGGTGAGYDVYDEAKAIAVDTSGNVYFTGTVLLNSTNKQDIVTGMLDSNGNNLWFMISNISNGDDAGNAITVDNSGNVYTTGQYTGGSDLNYVTIKYNSLGVIQWIRFYGGVPGRDDVPNSIAVDAGGNVVVTGTSDSSGSGKDIFTLKYNSAGVQQWSKRYNGSANSSDAGYSVAVDKGGNAYVCGMINQSIGNENGVVIKYKNDAGGTQRWLKTVNLTSTTGAENLVSLKLDTSKTRIYAAGYSYATGLFNTDYTIVKLDSAGNQQWLSTYDQPGSSYDLAFGLALDENENSYITGVTYLSGADLLTVKFNSSGILKWSKVFNGSSNGEENLSGNNNVAVDKSGNVFIAGSSYDSITGAATTVIKYKQSGTSLNLTAIIQGFYNSGTDLMISDSAKVILRSATAPYSVIDSAKAVLNASGGGTFFFSNVSDGVNYYIVIKHRNGLETWSSTGNAFTAGSLTFDFSTAANKAYGNNQIQADASPVKYAVFSGDQNQDGNINLTDIVNIFNDCSNFVTGYAASDLNGNTVCDLTDILLAFNNASGFVSKKTP